MEDLLIFIYFILILILSASVLIAGFFDLKYKIIPNELSYLLILTGVITNLVISFLIREIYPLLFSIILGIIIFLISYILWKLRLWGGGDVKLITGITVAMPIHPGLLNEIFRFNINNISLPILSIYPFPFTLIFNSILISFPFLIVFVVLNYLNNIKVDEIANNKKNLKINESIKNLIFKLIKNLLYNLFYLIKNIITSIDERLIFNKLIKSTITSLFLLIIILLFKNYKFNSLNSIFYILIAGILISLIFSIFLDYLISNFRIFVKKGSYKFVDINNLKEKMILSDILININDLNKSIKGNMIDLNLIKKIEFYNKNYSDNTNININIYKINDKYILKSITAGGLSKTDLDLLKELAKIQIIPKIVPIKLGIPFAPSIAIGFFISLFIGDLSLFIYNILNCLI